MPHDERAFPRRLVSHSIRRIARDQRVGRRDLFAATMAAVNMNPSIPNGIPPQQQLANGRQPNFPPDLTREKVQSLVAVRRISMFRSENLN